MAVLEEEKRQKVKRNNEEEHEFSPTCVHLRHPFCQYPRNKGCGRQQQHQPLVAQVEEAEAGKYDIKYEQFMLRSPYQCKEKEEYDEGCPKLYCRENHTQFRGCNAYVL